MPKKTGDGRKRGAMSTEEENFIKTNALDMNCEEMAEHLKRTPGFVEKFIKRHQLKETGVDEDEHQRWRSILYSKPYWPIIKRQFSPDEVRYFEGSWIRHYIDFGGDVRHGEDLQIKQWITIDIRMDQNQIRQHEYKNEEDRLKTILIDEYDKEIEDRDIASIAKLEQNVSANRSAAAHNNKVYLELLKEHKDITSKLKASRDQRKNINEDAHQTWPGFLRMLDQPGKRDIVGRDLELRRLAADKAMIRLSKWHKYQNDEIDAPLLTPELKYLRESEEDDAR